MEQRDFGEKNISNYATAIIHAHQSFERLDALAEIAPDLDGTDFWMLFAIAWRYTDIFYPHQRTLRDLLTPDRLNAPERTNLNTDEEQKVWRERIRRRKPLTVYRGGDYRNLTGFSWTTKRSLAEKFAREGSIAPEIVVGKLDPRHIVMPFNGRGEHEVCAFPEHVEVASVEKITPDEAARAGRPHRFATRAELTIPMCVDVLLARVASGEDDLDKLLHGFGKEATFLDNLGFTGRPAFIRQLRTQLETYRTPEAEAA